VDEPSAPKPSAPWNFNDLPFLAPLLSEPKWKAVLEKPGAEGPRDRGAEGLKEQEGLKEAETEELMTEGFRAEGETQGNWTLSSQTPQPLSPSVAQLLDSIPEDHKLILDCNPWLKRYPYLMPNDNIQGLARDISICYMGKFCWSTSFEPNFVASLIYQGYLPMAEGGLKGPIHYIFLPKLHLQRCVLKFEDLHIQKQVRKRSSRFEISCDQCFNEVIEGCLQQHGENWLYPPILEVFKYIFEKGEVQGVKMHSFELWQNNTLVAGEMGYSVGGCYTSLSGFSRVNSAGSVQCVATAKLLQQSGASFWDLGMALEYKIRMGAKCVPRAEFLEELREVRSEGPLRLPEGRVNCKQLARY